MFSFSTSEKATKPSETVRQVRLKVTPVNRVIAVENKKLHDTKK